MNTHLLVAPGRLGPVVPGGGGDGGDGVGPLSGGDSGRGLHRRATRLHYGLGSVGGALAREDEADHGLGGDGTDDGVVPAALDPLVPHQVDIAARELLVGVSGDARHEGLRVRPVIKEN